MFLKAIKKKFLPLLIMSFVVNLTACATERTATGDPIESGTIQYQISEEELEEYLSKEERVKFFGDFLPNDAVKNKFVVELDRETTASFVLAALEDVGWLHKKKQIKHVTEIVGMVNSGFLNMSKAALWIELEEENGSTVVSILAMAFEGMIKQNTNGKAIERFTISLEEKSGEKVKIR